MTNRKYYICVTPFFPSPENWRGAYVLDQVKAIKRNSDYEVLVFKPETEDYELEGIKVYGFKTIETPSYVFNGIFNSINSRSLIKKVSYIGLNLEEVKYVHCHTGMFGAYGLALKSLNPKVKVLLQHHDLDVFTVMNGKFAGWKLNNHYRARKAISIFNEVDIHVCISEPVKDSLLSFPNARKSEVYEPYLKRMNQMKGLPSVHPKKIIILNNGVDTKLFNHIHSEKTDKYEYLFRIGCIANFQTLKNHITLLKALDILINKGYHNMRLSLLGTGTTRQECEKYIRIHDLDKYVEWPDEVSHNKLPQYYKSLDIFVLPSIFEGFGCVYTEAAACGVPFIGVKNQGAAEYLDIEESTKWLIEPYDYRDLSNKIETYYKNKCEQKLQKTFDIDILIKDFLNSI